MIDLYPLIRPLFFKLQPETAHHITLWLMKLGLTPRHKIAPDPALEVNIVGQKFPNPIGLAAGFDKNAEVIGAAFAMGFGFVEVGTVTPRPQSGNPKPRIFRDPDNHAVINRMGFPNKGMEVFKHNLSKFLGGQKHPHGAVGINIGMNKTQKDPAKDYCQLIRMLAPMADYLTINISSPNTPGLRDLQKREPLLALLKAVRAEREKACGQHPPPLFLKLAPDLDEAQQKELAAVALESGIDGLILTNTTLDRLAHLDQNFAAEAGGLSGAPVRDKSTEVIRNFYRLTKGQIPIIGAGGVSSADDAYEKICAGASLVQVYSFLVFHGPSMVNSIIQDLKGRLNDDGYDNISEAVGSKAGLENAEQQDKQAHEHAAKTGERS